MSSNDFNLDSLTSALQSTKVSPSGVTFEGKSLKLNSKEDAKPVIEAINNCSELEYLNLEGNTLGVEAAEAIAGALEHHPEFKKALWKDMFTGRMKTEIPKALEFLGKGLVKAGARLTELDLSDNAFGPIGVEGLAALLRSPTCYALEELRLNNNGLGITGGKLLAAALTDCYNNSKKEGKPLALKVFIAGRNRLENEGAKSLAAVFKMIQTLEEIAMPQNGIYHIGIEALSDAFTHNKNLKILNLNDNTIGEKGAKAIGNVLPELQNLTEINFGDCLLKTKGSLHLARGLESGHENLEKLLLEFNEIKKPGGLALANAIANKRNLKKVGLDGNQFGSDGVREIEAKFQEIGKVNILDSLGEDQSASESEGESEHSEEEPDMDQTIEGEGEDMPSKISVEDFLENPSAQNLLLLGNNKEQEILNQAKKNEEINLTNYMSILMKISALTNNSKPDVAECSTKIADKLYEELFQWAQKADNLPTVNNAILVNLGLLKSEDKNFKPLWSLPECLKSMKNVVKQSYIPQSTRDALQVFLQREVDRNGENLPLKKEVLYCLK